MNRVMWYRNPEVLFNLVSVGHSRELVFLSKDEKVYTVRNISAHYMDLLKKNFDAFHFFDKTYNLYYSLGKFKNIRIFSFNPSTRKEQRMVWNAEALSNMICFDWGLDFDAPSHERWEDAWLDAKTVKDAFDKHGVPYSLKWSGSKGFHFRISGRFLPKRTFSADTTDTDSVFLWLKSVSELIAVKYGLKTLDLGIFDPRRLWKADYSWVCETDLIALPLSDEQFDKFNLELCKPLTVLKSGLRNRGSLERNGSAENINAFLKEELGVDD